MTDTASSEHFKVLEKEWHAIKAKIRREQSQERKKDRPPKEIRPETRTLACKRYPVAKLNNDKQQLLPLKYLEALEQNQKIASCCRHPENHEIEAWYSDEAARLKGVPDIYILHCTCGRQHRRFCVGGGDIRPFWDVR